MFPTVIFFMVCINSIAERATTNPIYLIVDYDDWRLNKTVFSFLDASWGPHTVDCFVSPHNKQVKRFPSCFWSPGCEAVDTFTVNWGNEINWWLPPFAVPSSMLPNVRQKEH